MSRLTVSRARAPPGSCKKGKINEKILDRAGSGVANASFCRRVSDAARRAGNDGGLEFRQNLSSNPSKALSETSGRVFMNSIKGLSVRSCA